jgi:hypothetical protein
MEFYSAIKKREILSFEGKCIELENIILSKVNQVQKTKGLMFSLICGTKSQYKYKQYYENRLSQGQINNRKGRVRDGS